MNGEWIGNRWWSYRPERSAEYNRLSRKATVLLAKSDRCRTGTLARLYCAYVDASQVVMARLQMMDERRLAA